MSVVVKGGLAAAVLAVGCTGTYFLMTGKGNGPITLAEDSDNKNNESNGYNSKIGGDFKHFLVSPFNEKNKSFWEKAYERLNQATDDTNRSDDFKKTTKVTKAFTANKTGNANDDDKALNRVCDTVYKKAKTEITGTDTDNKKKNLVTDLFTYCSVLGGLPKTVKEFFATPKTNSYGDNNLGKTKEDKLISIEGNDTWWSLKTQEFFGAAEPTGDAFFKKFYNDEKNKPDKQSLKTQCEKAYKLQANGSSDDSKPTEAEALKYCSLLGS